MQYVQPVFKKNEWRMPVEVWDRICGYYRPVQHWNKGKQQEFKERVGYNLCPPACDKKAVCIHDHDISHCPLYADAL